MAVQILNRYTGAVIATIAGSTLSGVSFGGLNLTDANFAGLDVSGSNFRGVNVSGATFNGANCNGANFYRSNVRGVDFRNIQKDTSSNFLCCFFESVLIDPGNAPVIVHLMGGQSNDVGTEAGPVPSPMPDPSIPFSFNQIGTVSTGGIVDLQINPSSGNHGAEVTFAKAMRAAGYDIAQFKFDRGATTMSDWLPGTSDFNALAASCIQSIEQLPARFPGRFFRFLMSWYLGENDARAATGGASLYGQNYLLYQGGIESLVSQSMWKKCGMVLMPSWLANQEPNSMASVQYWQRTLAGFVTNVDALPRQGDNVHLTADGEDQLGLLRYAQTVQQLQEPWP